MLTLRDCIDFCGLSDEEIAAISEHEHLPPIVAAEFASYICQTPEGEPAIRQIILDDIEVARRRGDVKHMGLLVAVLRHFVDSHPKCIRN